MERDQSFWITSIEHQGTMPERIFSFSCSMQRTWSEQYIVSKTQYTIKFSYSYSVSQSF
jgi:hypothetical protein